MIKTIRAKRLQALMTSKEGTMASRPKISRIYKHNKIIFKCRRCGTEFNFYEDKEQYCHCCGAKQNWRAITFSSVTQEAFKAYLNMSFQDQQMYLEKLDRMQADRGRLRV